MVVAELPDLAPLTGPLVTIETAQRAPAGVVAHVHAKVVHVMAGRCRIEVGAMTSELSAGDVLVLGAGTSFSAEPAPWWRSWTIYLDEAFLRQHMRWAIPPHAPLRQGVPPAEWDGRPLRLRIDAQRMLLLEPIFRRMSTLTTADNNAAAATNLALFAQAVALVVPCFLKPGPPPTDPRDATRVRRAGRPPMRAEVRKAVNLLENDLARSWRVEDLASTVVLSHSQRGRLFHRHLGLAPIQFLAELRLTEFSRLIEETDLAIGEAARRVGWNDPRGATIRFRRRYGVTPSRYRRGR